LHTCNSQKQVFVEKLKGGYRRMNPDLCVADPARYPNKADDVFNTHEKRRQRAIAQCLTAETIAEYAANPLGVTGPHSLNLKNLLHYFATWGVGGAWHRVVAINAGSLYGIARIERGAAPRLLAAPRCDTFEGIIIALFELRCTALRECLERKETQ
jgi:hypothetical protein